MTLILLIAGAYLIGSVMSGYVVGRVLGGFDIREKGTGNVGARNAGRLLGKKAFVFTFLGDALKGTAVIFLGKGFDITIEGQLLLLMAVVIGHLYPITLRFQGGKGIATFLGGFAVIAWQPFLWFAAGFLLFFAITRSLTVGGMLAILIAPLSYWIAGYDWQVMGLVLVNSLTLIFAHKSGIQERLTNKKGA